MTTYDTGYLMRRNRDTIEYSELGARKGSYLCIKLHFYKPTKLKEDKMNYTAEKLIAIAAAEVGYKEKKTNSQLDDPKANAGDKNWTKYARDLHNAGYYNGNKNGYAWCDVFVDHCFWVLCGKDAKKAQEIECQTGNLGAGCKYSAGYYEKQGRLYKSDPKPGDQIFFRNSAGSISHTGIIESVDGKTIHTIEGNTNNEVKRMTRKIGDGYTYAFGRPKYDAPAQVAATPPVDSPSKESNYDFRVGDLVKITGNTYYSGAKIPTWVKALKWYVRSISGVRVVIDKSENGDHSICSPINACDLELVKPAAASGEIKVGDIVKITGTKYYSGAKIPAWVKKKNWIVFNAPKGSDRVVINKSVDGKNAIMSPVKRSDLELVNT